MLMYKHKNDYNNGYKKYIKHNTHFSYKNMTAKIYTFIKITLCLVVTPRSQQFYLRFPRFANVFAVEYEKKN